MNRLKMNVHSLIRMVSKKNNNSIRNDDIRTIAWVLSVLLCSSAAFAQRPAPSADAPSHILSYQGVLHSSTGPVEGKQSVTIRLYGHEDAIDPIWEDVFAVPIDRNGIFSIQLGSQIPLPDAATMSSTPWLGMSIGSEPELRPLSRLGASPFALSIADNSVTESKMATDYVRSVSINGKKVTSRGSDLNIIAGEGFEFSFDEATHSLILAYQAAFKTATKGAVAEAGSDTLKVEKIGEAGKKTGVLEMANAVNSNVTNVKAVSTNANRNYLIPDAGGDASFVMTAGDQTISGHKTFSGGLNLSGGSIQNISDPTCSQDAATKRYVDYTVSSLLSAIDSDLAGRMSAESAVCAEATARASADAIECNARQAADISETNARQSADNLLSANLNGEVNRARSAQSNLQESLNSEIADRLNGDNWLQNLINTKAADASVVHLSGNENVDGSKLFTEPIIANITGNAASVTNGVYTNNVYDNPDWIASLASDKIVGTFPISQTANLTSTLNGKAMDNAVVHRTGSEMISGIKTFSSTIVGSISGNAATATNGVVTTGYYSNPTWITTLASTKICGNIPQCQVTDLIADLASKQNIILKGNGSLNGASGTVDIPVDGAECGDLVIVTRTAFASGVGHYTGNTIANAGINKVTVRSDELTDNGSFLVMIVK